MCTKRHAQECYGSVGPNKNPKLVATQKSIKRIDQIDQILVHPFNSYELHEYTTAKNAVDKASNIMWNERLQTKRMHTI